MTSQSEINKIELTDTRSSNTESKKNDLHKCKKLEIVTRLVTMKSTMAKM